MMACLTMPLNYWMVESKVPPVSCERGRDRAILLNLTSLAMAQDPYEQAGRAMDLCLLVELKPMLMDRLVGLLEVR